MFLFQILLVAMLSDALCAISSGISPLPSLIKPLKTTTGNSKKNLGLGKISNDLDRPTDYKLKKIIGLIISIIFYSKVFNTTYLF